MANLDDILTTQKNGVVAINTINQVNYYLAGRITSATIPAASSVVVATGSGRIINYSVTVSGSTAGSIYNAAAVANILPSNTLLTTTSNQEVGVYPVGLVFSSGLIVVTGTGQSLNVTYSLD